MVASFEVYQDNARQWRWRFRAGNGRIVADSSEGYNNRVDCENGIRIVKTESPGAPTRG